MGDQLLHRIQRCILVILMCKDGGREAVTGLRVI